MITVTVMRSNRVLSPWAPPPRSSTALGLAGCAGASTSTPDVVHVVAAENFWGNITARSAGETSR